MGRTLGVELLESAGEREAAANLADLARINRWFGGHRIVLSLLEELRASGDFSLLDAGSASGDHGAAIRARYPQARVVSLDISERNLRGAAGPKLVGDVRALPFGRGSFDYVYCSLLVHHFSDESAAGMLSALGGLARKALIAVDLERHPLPLWFLPATRLLMGWEPLTVHDGQASVRAGFSRREWVELASRAGLEGGRIRRHCPWFRISLVAPRQFSTDSPNTPKPSLANVR
jgi:SAM-dependent methyltransferase